MKSIIVAILTLTCGLIAWEKPHLSAQVSNPSNVIEITSMQELKSEIDTKGMVFVDFYSSSCPPCKRLAPKYAEYSVDLSSEGKFLKVNVYEVKGVLDSYGIKAFPTMIVFENGKEKDRVVGMPNIPQYFEKMK